jgi:hypothetical protein
MIVIVAVKLNVEYEAVGEPNPHPGNMASVACVTGEHCVENLERSIRNNSLQGREESKTALRELVDGVVVSPPESDGGQIKIEVRGYLARLVGGDLFPQRSCQGGTMVAEEGLEPPTRGL